MEEGRLKEIIDLKPTKDDIIVLKIDKDTNLDKVTGITNMFGKLCQDKFGANAPLIVTMPDDIVVEKMGKDRAIMYAEALIKRCKE